MIGREEGVVTDDGEQLIRAVEEAYPPELREALRLGRLMPPDVLAAVAEAAGVPQVHSARVHGELVVWSRYDEDGGLQRGALPYTKVVVA